MSDSLPIADRTLLSRRLLLRGMAGGSALVPALAVAKENKFLPEFQPPWMLEPGDGFRPYGMPAPSQEAVKRILTPMDGFDRAGTSRTPLHQLEGTITPNGLHFERHHNGVPAIDPAKHQLFIHGMVQRPLVFTLDQLLRYPMESRFCFIECGGNSMYNARPEAPQMSAGAIHGLISCSQWTGVRLAPLLADAGVDRAAQWVIAEGADAAAVSRSIPMQKCLDDAMIALYQNGEAIRPEQGFPMRLLLPGFEGNMQIKWLRRLKVVKDPALTRDETARYTDLMPNGKALQFVLRTKVKSVILRPSQGLQMYGPGVYEISGLAWSGSGKIKKVDVSTDGGQGWTEASLDEPVIVNSLVRFRLPWRWDGVPVQLMSRATDENGFTQPTRREWSGQFVPGQAYHYNAIQTWNVTAQGHVTNAYI